MFGIAATWFWMLLGHVCWVVILAVFSSTTIQVTMLLMGLMLDSEFPHLPHCYHSCSFPIFYLLSFLCSILGRCLLILPEGSCLFLPFMTVISKISWSVLTWYCFVNHVLCDLCSLMAPFGCSWVCAIFILIQNKNSFVKAPTKFSQMCITCNHFILGIVCFRNHDAVSWIFFITSF